MSVEKQRSSTETCRVTVAVHSSSMSRDALRQVNPHVTERVGMWISMSGRPGLWGDMDRWAA